MNGQSLMGLVNRELNAGTDVTLTSYLENLLAYIPEKTMYQLDETGSIDCGVIATSTVWWRCHWCFTLVVY